MSRQTHPIWVVAALSILLLAGCETDSRDQVMATTESQLALRQIQSRAFDTTDRNMMLRTIIATLQDLSFVIDEADERLGSVSGTKLDGYYLRMTVSIRPKGETQLLVRANAQFNRKAVEEPEPYQQFFAALGKSLFLTSSGAEASDVLVSSPTNVEDRRRVGVSSESGSTEKQRDCYGPPNLRGGAYPPAATPFGC
jgi:hypothetical protein